MRNIVIIGARSVVDNISDNCVIAGSSAKLIKLIEEKILRKSSICDLKDRLSNIV